MTPTLRQYVAGFTPEELKECAQDYNDFEAAGTIGDCMMRRKTTAYVDMLGVRSMGVGLWMQMLSFEVYRRLAGY